MGEIVFDVGEEYFLHEFLLFIVTQLLSQDSVAFHAELLLVDEASLTPLQQVSDGNQPVFLEDALSLPVVAERFQCLLDEKGQFLAVLE